MMNDLSAWFEQQHHGLHTFRSLQQKALGSATALPSTARRDSSCTISSHPIIDVHDEAPLPAIDAERVHRRMAELLATIDLGAPAERRLADFNRIASCDLMN